MSEIINRLNMEYKIIKRSIKLTLKNLKEDSLKRNSESSLAKQFSILDCSIDQHNQLFRLARDNGEISIMKSLIKNNFRRERLMIQNLAIKIYRVTRPMAVEIIYDMWRRSINEELQFLHNDYEDLVQNSSAEELLGNSDYHRVLELFEDHQQVQRVHDELYQEAKANNNIDGMDHSIASDIPTELKIVQKIKEIISRLQLK